MKKIYTILILMSISFSASAKFAYMEIDPICSISGTTHTHSATEVSDTSSWSIPIAYDGECENIPTLSGSEEIRIYNAMINFFEKKDFLEEGKYSGYGITDEGQKYIKDRFFPAVQSFIIHERAKPQVNTTHLAILNYAVSMIGYDYYITDKNLSGDYIGLTVEDAQKLAVENGVSLRVVQEDGEYYAVTMDYRPGRINAVVEEGIVISYTVE